MFIRLIELLIHLADNPSESYMLIYHPDPNELSSLKLKTLVGDGGTPVFLFPLLQVQNEALTE